MRFDQDIGGRSWFGYAFDRMERSVAAGANLARYRFAPSRLSRSAPILPGDILSEFVSMLQPPQVTGPYRRGRAAIRRGVEGGTASERQAGKNGKLLRPDAGSPIHRRFLQGSPLQVLAFSKALNEEYHRLADAGCAVIQIEEPCLHNTGGVEGEVPFSVYIEAFNAEVAGLREKTEVWCHTCWGNPFAQRLAQQPSYKPTLPHLANSMPRSLPWRRPRTMA